MSGDKVNLESPEKARRAVLVGLVLSATWLALVVLFFLTAGLGDGTGLGVLPVVMVIVAVVGPLALIASVSVAMALVAQASQLRDMGRILQNRRPPPAPSITPALNQLGDQVSELTERLGELELWLAERAASIEAASVLLVADSALDRGGDGRLSAPEAAPDEQSEPSTPDLGLVPESDAEDVPLNIFIRALEFPADQNDQAGFDALRVALARHDTAQLVTAAQDVLTLLSQDGLYMDDLVPDRARVELWRRFARGERGGPVAAVGGIRDDEAVDLCIARMRQDTIFRDAVHHFLRLFDHTFADVEPDATDTQIADWSETRSARAFMLLGRAAGIFHD